jgi:hypothetical protein
MKKNLSRDSLLEPQNLGTPEPFCRWLNGNEIGGSTFMKHAKKILIAILLCLFSAAALQAADIQGIIRSAPDASKYPDANAIILFSEKNYELLDKGKSTEDALYLIKVLTAKGREKFSDQKVPFNKEKDQLTLVKAGTYHGESRFTELEKKAINDVTPLELSGAEIYANFLNRVFSFPVVDPGATLFMELRKATDLKQDQNIGDRQFFQFEEPLIKKIVTITLPPGKKLRYRFLNGERTLAASADNAKTRYTMEAGNVPMIKDEEYMPPMEEVAGNLLFSTCATWDEAVAPLSREFFKACAETQEIRALAGELTKGCTSRDDKIRAISAFMVAQVRGISISLGLDGYKPHEASLVLMNKYGDCRDKAVLMVTLLKSCGVESFPALVVDDLTPVVKEVPTMKQFDSLMVALPGEKGGYRFLDPFAERAEFGFVGTRLDAEALVVKPAGSPEFAPLIGYRPIESAALNSVEGTIDGQGDFAGTLASDLHGIYDISARAHLHSLRGKKIDMWFEQRAEEFCPEARDRGHHYTDPQDLSNHMKVTMTTEAKDLAIVQDSLMILKIPRLPFPFARTFYAPSLPTREYPFELGSCNENVFTFRVKLPAGYKPIYMPGNSSTTLPCGLSKRSCVFNEKSGEILFERTLKITTNRLPAADYPAFKRSLEDLSLMQNNLVILKKI